MNPHIISARENEVEVRSHRDGVDRPLVVLQSFPRSAPRGTHAVQFYEDAEVLLEGLVRFVGASLGMGDAAVVLARAAHQTELAERLAARGLDVEGATVQGRYIALDAAVVLAQIMRDGQLNSTAFMDVVGDILDQAAAAAVSKSPRVAVFGELVTLLCEMSDYAAAIRLEQLWNDLAQTRAFSLLCAYPMETLLESADPVVFDAICAAHSRIVPVENSSARLDETERQQAIAQLQQRAHTLETQIAEREQAKALLHQREADLIDFIEEVPIALHWVGPDGTILWANRAELDLLGYARDEYVGRHINEFHADQIILDDILARLARRESLQDYEAQLRCKDGSVRDVLINSNVQWENSDFIHTRCVTRDVTDHRKAELISARLAAIVNSSSDAIIGKTLDGTVTSWNQAAERMYGYTAEEMIGQPITTIVGPERQAEVADFMERLARGESIAHHDTERVRKDGTRIDISVSISPIRDHRGRVIGASTIARDISERRAMERQKQEFLEMVAHDLGSPLTVVLGYAQLLQRRRTFDEQALSAIADKAAHMGRLVDDMLDMARLEAGRLELRRTTVDLTALARVCIDQASLIATNRAIRLEAPERSVVGAWDRDRLAQVLTNLIDNALKYAPDGEIVVRITECHNEAQVAIIDRGPGLTPEELQRVFEHFYRSQSSSAGTKGVGLGLFICKSIIEAHGGRLWAESALGEGSTFALALPYLEGMSNHVSVNGGTSTSSSTMTMSSVGSAYSETAKNGSVTNGQAHSGERTQRLDDRNSRPA